MTVQVLVAVLATALVPRLAAADPPAGPDAPEPSESESNWTEVLGSPNFTVGASGASAVFEDGTYGFMGGLEVTGTIRFAGVHLWASNGYRFRFVHTLDAYLYYEAGFWALFNLGGGVSFGGTGAFPIHFHFFAGLPIPLAGIAEEGLFPGFFVEPYYRPMLSFKRPGETTITSPFNRLPGDETVEEWTHEVGIMLKLTSVTFTWPWE